MTIRIDQVIQFALLADATIASIAGARVYTRELKQEGPRSMPEAFMDGRPLPSLVVRAGQRVEDGFNPEAATIYPMVYLHGPNTDQGWQAIDDLVSRIRELAPTIQLPAGTVNGGMELYVADELGTMENETWPGSILNYVRLTDSVIWT